MQDCLFCKFAKKEMPKDFLFEDDELMAFSDIRPVKPVHILIVPKRHIPELSAVDDMLLFGKAMKVVQQMINKFSLADKGYRVVINGGGAQEVNHLHIHLMGPIGSQAAM